MIKKTYIGSYESKREANQWASFYLDDVPDVYKVEVSMLKRVNGKNLYVVHAYKETKMKIKKRKKKTNLQKMDKFLGSAVK